MMFTDWFKKHLDDTGYNQEFITQSPEYDFLSLKDRDTGEMFYVMYLKRETTLERIRDVFSVSGVPVLYIVDSALMPPLDPMYHYANIIVPLWLRAIHALYYGRIYIWNGDYIEAVHVTWSNGTVQSSGYIDITGVLFTHVDCKLYDFPGLFNIARFYDRAFWKTAQQPPREKQRAKTEPPKQPPAQQGLTYYGVFLACNSLAEMKRKHRELAKKHHPDLNPGDSNATETMQLINAAFDRAKALYS